MLPRGAATSTSGEKCFPVGAVISAGSWKMRPACVGRRRGALLLSWILAYAPCRAISSRISGLRSGGPDVGSGRRTCAILNDPLITGDEHPVPDGLSGGQGPPRHVRCLSPQFSAVSENHRDRHEVNFINEIGRKEPLHQLDTARYRNFALILLFESTNFGG